MSINWDITTILHFWQLALSIPLFEGLSCLVMLSLKGCTPIWHRSYILAVDISWTHELQHFYFWKTFFSSYNVDVKSLISAKNGVFRTWYSPAFGFIFKICPIWWILLDNSPHEKTTFLLCVFKLLKIYCMYSLQLNINISTSKKFYMC